MTELHFNYQGRKYEGQLTCSVRMAPHYYWFTCKDEELITLIGEDVAFIMKDENLKPLNYTLAERYPELFGKIIHAILNNIAAPG